MIWVSVLVINYLQPFYTCTTRVQAINTLKTEPTAMANKKSSNKKPKQSAAKSSGKKGGAMDFSDIGSPKPVRKQKKKK